MGLIYETRGTDTGITAVDTAVPLTTFGGTAGTAISVGNFRPPAGVTAIRYIKVAIGCDGAGVGAGTYVLKLKGKGVKVNQSILVATYGGQNATGDNCPIAAFKLHTDIDVRPGNDILVTIENDVVDLGSSSAEVTLGYGPSGGAHMEYHTRCGAIANDDVMTELSSDGSDGTSAAQIQVPDSAVAIKHLISGIASDSSVTGEIAAYCRLSGGTQDGDQDFAMNGAGGTLATSAPMGLPADIDEVDLAVKPSKNLVIHAGFTGSDIGSASAGVCVGFQTGGQ